ncbi:tetratricopeptide repeat protein [Thiothrix litoralis]|uniref:Tetratricopeptide repeat protein n=1 Tax=Thiothrix litoralis TaxID=2891210 RepID=A0ABX7WUS0_9GAMM|nr:tetratricopeptide repeat protein [Thiothrix litoralis]QTR45404.1 tetratricopeptide repeat protein [Thiothrix litoralis]
MISPFFGQADKTARKYHWLNFHPASEAQGVRDWFTESMKQFREQHQVYPLVLQGEIGIGRRYLLEAAHFRQTRDGLPVVVFHWDMELRDAPNREAQLEHMQAKLENFEQQLEVNNASLWAKLKQLGEVVEAKLPLNVGQAEISLDLNKLMAWLFLPGSEESKEEEGADAFKQMEARFRQLLRDSHLILHVRNAELLDQGLLEKLWHTVKWLNDAAAAETGFMGLAFSFTSAYPLRELLGARERYALVSVLPLSSQRVLRALRETYGDDIASHAVVEWLLTHTALHSGVVDAEHLGKLLDTLMDEGLLGQVDDQWMFASTDDLAAWRSVVGKNIEALWLSRWERVPAKLQAKLRALFGLAALGGEWIPVDVLLDYLEIDNKDERDDLVDVLDDVYVNTSPALLQCMDWRFVGMSGQGLVYRFHSPLLPALIADPATRKDLAQKLLVWLQQRWPAPSRNQAAYLLRLANHADRAVAQALRERLAWQVEAEFAAELQAHVLDKLESGELSLATLSRIMRKHHLVWPMPRRRAICRAWFSFYQRSLRDVPAQANYVGGDWDALWQVADDSPIPATAEGLSLCFFYGTVQEDAGEYGKAEQLVQLGLSLCKKHKNLDMEASFHSILATIEHTRGDLASAEKRLRDFAVPMFRQVGNTRSVAVAYGRIADILQARGQLDEALNIRQTEQLPVYEKLGDVRSKAVTMGKIADILQARGQLDEALNIRQTEELPVYEKLGDVRSKAVTMGKIADILQARGQLDEALNIRQTEQLPVYEKLGDVRSKAVTERKIADILIARGQLDEGLKVLQERCIPPMEKIGAIQDVAVFQGIIADILQARGQLDEALNTLNETLPVYEKLGAVREKAVTMGKIADILQARGQLDEALNTLNETLPVYEKLGAVREKAVTMGKIADILQARGQLDEALNTLNETLPVYEKLGAVREKAVTMGKIADILQARGQLDEALNTLNETLPVYEKLGDVHSLLVGRAKLAMLLWQMDAAVNAARVQELLCLALSDARRLRIPEAGIIENILSQRGLSCDK